MLKLAYQLRVHRLGDWGLDRWGVTLAWGASAAILAQWVVRGRPELPAWHWGVLALLILGGLALLALRGWAARRSYVVFEPESGSAPPAGRAMSPEDKAPVRATGRFEVNGRVSLFADLTAYWRSYASREHAVLAIQHQTRFLIGRSPEEDAGMWYLFIQPEAVEGITPGRLRYGGRTDPALRVVYRWQPPAAEGKRPPRPLDATAYLAFEDAAPRDVVWADLLAGNK